MKTIRHPNIVATAYEDCLPRIISLVQSFQRRYGGDEHEFMSLARYNFVLAYVSYNQSNERTFDSWVSLKLWHALYDHYRWEVRDRNRRINNPPPTSYHINPILESLSDNAQKVATLLNDTPAELQTLFQTDPGSGIRSLRSYLKQLGWTGRQIKTTFAEIKDAINQT